MAKERPPQLALEITPKLKKDLDDIFPHRGLKTHGIRMWLSLLVREVKAGNIDIADLLTASIDAQATWAKYYDSK